MATNPSQDRAKAKGLLSKVTSFQFVVHVLLFHDILAPLARLSLTWQKEAVEIPHMPAVEKCPKDSLAHLSVVDPEKASCMDTLVDASNDDVSFKDVKLCQVAQCAAFFARRRANYIECVKECCAARFCLADTTQVFNSVSILDTNLWSDDDERLAEHGDECLAKAAEHFVQVLGPDVDTDQLMNEWHELKVFIAANRSEIWRKVHAFYADRYPCVAHVINILRVLPFSNALVERCFSAINKIKTNWWASLDTETLNKLIRIKKTGPEIDHSFSVKAVEVFFARKTCRPSAQRPWPCKRPESEASEADAPPAKLAV